MPQSPPGKPTWSQGKQQVCCCISSQGRARLQAYHHQGSPAPENNHLWEDGEGEAARHAQAPSQPPQYPGRLTEESVILLIARRGCQRASFIFDCLQQELERRWAP
jgi:hypothetical protein